MKKTTFCVRIFDISPCVFTQISSERACWMWNLILQRVPTLHTFYGPCYPKNKKYLKKVMMTSSSHFSGIYSFRGSRVCQKYAVWVLVGCGIKFRIQ